MIRNRVEDFFPLRSFLISLAALSGFSIAVISAVTLLHTPPASTVETFVTVPEQTVAVKSGDLNQLDLHESPAPAAAEPQPKEIEDAVAGLHETTAEGLVPIIRSGDKLTALKAYAAAFEKKPDTKATISLVMVDYGLSKKLSSDAIKALPEGVSLLLSPYTKAAQQWTNDARKENREVWLSLPVQTAAYPKIDTGPYTLLTNMNLAENEKRLLRTLATSTGYAGVIVEEGNSFSSRKTDFEKIIASLSGRGLGLVQSDTKSPFIGEIAQEQKAAFGKNDFWIDSVSSEKDLQSKLRSVEAAAVKNGSVIVFFRPYPVLLKSLRKWSDDLASRQVQLAPLSHAIGAHGE